MSREPRRTPCQLLQSLVPGKLRVVVQVPMEAVHEAPALVLVLKHFRVARTQNHRLTA